MQLDKQICVSVTWLVGLSVFFFSCMILTQNPEYILVKFTLYSAIND